METKDLVTLIARDKGHRAIDLVVISLRGLQTLAAAASSATELGETARAMQRARPASACLQNILDEFCRRLESMGDADVGTGVADICNGLAEEMVTAQDTVANRMASLIADGDRIMAFSMSSTIRRVFEIARQQNKRVQAIVCESRPGMEGRLLANDLSRMNIETTCITESQIGIFMRDTDKAVLGADRLLANGDVVNKAGSLLVALAARHCEVPLYVGAESFKQSDREDFELEEFNVEELDLPKMSGVTARNFYLEILPDHLISRLITDK